MKVYVPQGSTEVSVRGMTMKAEVDGSIEVSHEVAQELKSVGCSFVPHAKPLTKDQQASADKTKASARLSYDNAVVARDAARSDLFETEGRGDNKATKDAKAKLDRAEANVVELGAKL